MPHTRFNHLQSEVDFYPHPDYHMSKDREYWPGPNRGDGRKHTNLSKDAKEIARIMVAFGEQGSASKERGSEGKTETGSKELARTTVNSFGLRGTEGKMGTTSKEPARKIEEKFGEQGSEGNTGTESKKPVERAEGYWRRDGVWISAG